MASMDEASVSTLKQTRLPIVSRTQPSRGLTSFIRVCCRGVKNKRKDYWKNNSGSGGLGCWLSVKALYSSEGDRLPLCICSAALASAGEVKLKCPGLTHAPSPPTVLEGVQHWMCSEGCSLFRECICIGGNLLETGMKNCKLAVLLCFSKMTDFNLEASYQKGHTRNLPY